MANVIHIRFFQTQMPAVMPPPTPAATPMPLAASPQTALMYDDTKQQLVESLSYLRDDCGLSKKVSTKISSVLNSRNS
jgi:hypothetical protein